MRVGRSERDEVEAGVTGPQTVVDHGCTLPSQVAQASHGVLHQAWIVPGSPEAHGAAARRLEVTVDKAVAGKNPAARAHQQGDAGLARGHRALQQNLPVTAERPAHGRGRLCGSQRPRSEAHASAMQALMRISYAVVCLQPKTTTP